MTNNNTPPANLYQASSQWASRPQDECFQEFGKLQDFTLRQKALSEEVDIPLKAIRVEATDGNGIRVLGIDGEHVHPTNWGFKQLCSALGAPAAYLQTLPAPIAVQCLQDGLEKKGESTESLRWLIQYENESRKRANLASVTSVGYGRIWNANVVTPIKGVIDSYDGRFFNPPARNHVTGKMEPSGLYASDRDFFAFFVDGGSVNTPTLDDGKSEIHHGFFASNSDVGGAKYEHLSFGLREVCGNHICWDVSDVKSTAIRHNRRAPERFVSEAMPDLRAFLANSGANLDKMAATIKAAQKFVLPTKIEEAVDFMRKRGFTGKESMSALLTAEQEEGTRNSLWDAFNGTTAFARSYLNMDARVNLEKRAGGLLSFALAAA
jgi:hypothetical protein